MIFLPLQWLFAQHAPQYLFPTILPHSQCVWLGVILYDVRSQMTLIEGS